MLEDLSSIRLQMDTKQQIMEASQVYNVHFKLVIFTDVFRTLANRQIERGNIV